MLILKSLDWTLSSLCKSLIVSDDKDLSELKGEQSALKKHLSKVLHSVSFFRMSLTVDTGTRKALEMALKSFPGSLESL